MTTGRINQVSSFILNRSFGTYKRKVYVPIPDGVGSTESKYMGQSSFSITQMLRSVMNSLIAE